MFLRTIAAGALALSVVLAACGDDDDSKSNNSSTPSSGTSSGAPASGGGGGGGGASVAAFCGEWVKASADAAKATSGGIGANPNDLKATVEQTNAFFKTAADRAPSEIRADMQVFAQVWTTLASALQKANYDFTKLATDPDAQKTLQSLSDARLMQASKNIEAWAQKHCTPGR